MNLHSCGLHTPQGDCSAVLSSELETCDVIRAGWESVGDTMQVVMEYVKKCNEECLAQEQVSGPLSYIQRMA